MIFVTAVLVFAAFYIGTSFEEAELVEVTGRMQTAFAVYYVENDLFPDNPVPANLHFIRQLTDYIKLTSGFSADFGRVLNVFYVYTARMHFVVQYTGSGMPVIFEETVVLSEVEGSSSAASLFFSPDNPNTPGGEYTIDLNDFETRFYDFVQQAVELQEAVDEDGAIIRNFGANLGVEFTYNIRVPAIGINETVTNGFNIPLGTSVFTLDVIGPSGFISSTAISPESPPLQLPLLAAFAAGLLLGGIGLYFGFKFLNDEENEKRKKANDIIKKYNTEIVISKDELDVSGLKLVMVDEFEGILKLSVNLGKHINCYKNHAKAEFTTVVDNFAYCYRIDYGKKIRLSRGLDLDEYM